MNPSPLRSLGTHYHFSIYALSRDRPGAQFPSSSYDEAQNLMTFNCWVMLG